MCMFKVGVFTRQLRPSLNVCLCIMSFPQIYSFGFILLGLYTKNRCFTLFVHLSKSKEFYYFFSMLSLVLNNNYIK
uniref:Putative ovule protein n=1 Tax=Solanum chacoense TaxID=4108 RepID=A0A0V0GRT2_SOLCH